MTGPPDLVVEIVSPESGLIDRQRTFDLYQRFGVKEYWIVDQDEKVVEVYRLGPDGSYRRAGAFGPEATITAEAVRAFRSVGGGVRRGELSEKKALPSCALAPCDVHPCDVHPCLVHVRRCGVRCVCRDRHLNRQFRNFDRPRARARSMNEGSTALGAPATIASNRAIKPFLRKCRVRTSSTTVCQAASRRP